MTTQTQPNNAPTHYVCMSESQQIEASQSDNGLYDVVVSGQGYEMSGYMTEAALQQLISNRS